MCATVALFSTSDYCNCYGKQVINSICTDYVCDSSHGYAGSCTEGTICDYYNCDGSLGTTYNGAHTRNCR